MNKVIHRKQCFFKCIIAMKLMLFILAVSLQVSATTTVHSQQVTLTAKNTPLRDVLQQIRKQTGYAFMYESDLLNDAKPVSVTLKQSPIEETLQIIFKNQPYNYCFKDRFILITSKIEKKTESVTEGRRADLSGRVTHKNGKPIAGVTISLKESSQGTVTDDAGRFVIRNAPADGTLVVTMIGRESKQVAYKNGLIVPIVLLEVNANLSEIQIIAYGEVKKKFLTSNIGSISGEQISRQPVTNPLLALQGQVPGLFIQQTSGNTLGNVNTLVQGRNSIRNGTEPFYVIDGVPYSPSVGNFSLAASNYPATTSGGSAGSAFNFINPSDIESVEILKDADATAIYGSRAANGAILITTKRGQAGQTKVNLNMQSGWGKIARRADLLNTDQYLELRKEAYKNDNLDLPNSTTTPAFSNYDLTIWAADKNHDWQEELVGGTANYTNIQSSVSGGTERTQFLVGAGYNKQTTVYPGDLADRKYNAHLNLNHISESRKFNFNLTVSYLQSTNTLAGEDLMNTALSLAPNAPELYNPDGSINWGPYPNNQNAYSFGNNPVAFLLQQYTGVTDNLLANTLLSYEVVPGLYLKSTLGYNRLTSDEMVLRSVDAISPEFANRQGSSEFMDKSIKGYIIEPQLNYTRNTSLGSWDFLLGTTFQQSETCITGYNATGFSNNNQLAYISAATSVTSSNRDVQSLYKYNALFARLNYRLKDKYILNLNVRRDGSSRFGDNNKLHNFYSVGAAWLFTEERSFKSSIPFLSTGKLRVNYGTTGNDQIGDYGYESLLQNSVWGMPYQDLVSIKPDRHNNPDLQWEETRKLNVGLDLGFFNERISLGGNWFRNRSSNQLIDYQLPLMTGFRTVTANFSATVQNAGFELLLNAAPIKSVDFDWQISFNATILKNKLVYFKNFENSTYASIYVIGQPINILRVYQYADVDPNTGNYLFKKGNGDLSPYPSYADDRTTFIDRNPKWYGGFSSLLRYKDFTFDLLLQYVNQQGRNDRFLLFTGGINRNVPTYVFENRWKGKGDVTDVEHVSTGFSLTNYYASQSSAAYSDASYLRLKNVAMSYTLPTKITERIGMKTAKIYVQGQNLLTFTSYRGIDPENTSFASLPPLRMYSIGLQVTF